MQGGAVVFFGFGGAALLPAVGFSGKSAIRFCIAFSVGYLIYAVIWSVAWFTIPKTIGEIVGSLIGLIAFGLILRKWMKLDLPMLSGVAILFLFHTVGYYLGGFAYDSLQNRGPAGIELSGHHRRYAQRLASPGSVLRDRSRLGVIYFCHLSRQSSDRPSTQI